MHFSKFDSCHPNSMELSSISTDGIEPDFTFDKILKKLISEESRLKRCTKDQHEAGAFETIGRNPKLSRKKSQPLPKKNIGRTRDHVKCTKYSRSSYIAEANLSQHHGKDTWIFKIQRLSPSFVC
ncbi:hypothetical protein TNIN_228671 [Trichonephila inaurata madagascariensis]|uniref:Uncharacterized protein n=1 Tax=Trichonephila inaurata madagascariensis TaxID=2747483 RepID=A0A8X6YMS6_9ARAC|nr:hypothetical protein TNIN_228671 [Trichonephila inaurata madagascariensis]